MSLEEQNENSAEIKSINVITEHLSGIAARQCFVISPLVFSSCHDASYRISPIPIELGCLRAAVLGQ